MGNSELNWVSSPALFSPLPSCPIFSPTQALSFSQPFTSTTMMQGRGGATLFFGSTVWRDIYEANLSFLSPDTGKGVSQLGITKKKKKKKEVLTTIALK